jgi:UDP-N-acetyl-D-glucosamine dehydrogenase
MLDSRSLSSLHALMNRFKALGAEVDFCDPHIPVITRILEHAIWTGKECSVWSGESMESHDAVVIATHHQAFNLRELIQRADLIVNTRNAIAQSGVETRSGQVYKA